VSRTPFLLLLPTLLRPSDPHYKDLNTDFQKSEYPKDDTTCVREKECDKKT
jgi:hypothetical protein